MKEKIACFLIPLLIAVVLLYQVLTDLQLAVTNPATLLVIGITLVIAAAAGALAAFGPTVVRVGVLAACALLFLDVTFHLSGVFNGLKPEIRTRVNRDEKRIADLHQIKSALDQYVAQVGPLPSPVEYGEKAGVPGLWEGWWDISSSDGDRDGFPFLDFLVDGGILRSVPTDPVNRALTKGAPHGGNQYVYFLVPPGYEYAGGTCDAAPNRWHYMVAITSLEEKLATSAAARGSGCPCLWRDSPNFFQQHFVYVLCGSLDATPESRARAAARAKHATEALARKQAAAAEALARKQAAELQKYVPQDQRRVADLLQIQKGLQQYLEKVGPLPAPLEYGEADSFPPGFWSRYWDVSSEDADGDGKPFLDFLVDGGIMPSVPVDPDNEAAKDHNPTGGRQYVYFVASPGETYEGGTCGSRDKKWVYLLGITDLRSEVTRPPKNIEGSGCECLWRDKPNFFQLNFDYVVCGTFSR